MRKIKFNFKEKVVEKFPLTVISNNSSNASKDSINAIIDPSLSGNSNKSGILIPVVDAETGEKKLIDFNYLKPPSKPRHDKLPEPLLNRIGIIYGKISEACSMTLEKFENGFKYDEHPEREVQVWELIAKTYQDFTNQKNLTISKKKQLYDFISGLSTGCSTVDLLKLFQRVTVHDLEVILDLWESNWNKTFNDINKSTK